LREVIQDVVKHASGLGFISEVKVKGSAETTVVEASDDQRRNVFLKATLKQPLPDLAGEFGIKSLKLLGGLCNFANYKAEKASLSVLRRDRQRPDQSVINVPDELVFQDGNGTGSHFRLTSAELVTGLPNIDPFEWEIEFKPSKSSILEFTQLAALYAEFDEYCTVKTKNGDLIFAFGKEKSSMHSATMVFQKDAGTLTTELDLPIAHLLNVFRLSGHEPTLMRFANRGWMLVQIESDHGVYDYMFPKKKK
jgi:hypothetical protein